MRAACGGRKTRYHTLSIIIPYILSTKKNYINVQVIRDLVYDDDTYVREFADAAIQSFSEFSAGYRNYLLSRDETNFRKAGHKIMPVAQMLHIPEISDEYERAKDLLQDDCPREKLQASARKMTKIIDDILAELREIA